MIHPSAWVHPLAQVHAKAWVGYGCVVEAGVQLGAGCVLEARVRVCTGTIIGENCKIYDGAVLGAPPQDSKYRGEPTGLELGAECIVREYCTLHRGTGEAGITRVGAGSMLMAYSHVAHDCQVGEQAVLANGVQLGGHVSIGQGAVLGGNTAVHQNCRVGDFAFVGGTLKVDRHVPPASKALGNPLRWAGLNLPGLRRRAFSGERIGILQEQYRFLYRSGHSLEAAWNILQKKGNADPLLLTFFGSCQGHVIRPGSDD